MKIPFKKGKEEWGEARGGDLCTRGGEARTQGPPPAPLEPRATLPSLLPKPVRAPGWWQLLMGGISAGEERIRWGSPMVGEGALPRCHRGHTPTKQAPNPRGPAAETRGGRAETPGGATRCAGGVQVTPGLDAGGTGGPGGTGGRCRVCRCPAILRHCH